MLYNNIIISQANKFIIYEIDIPYDIMDASMDLELNGLRFIMQQKDGDKYKVLFEKTLDYSGILL